MTIYSLLIDTAERLVSLLRHGCGDLVISAYPETNSDIYGMYGIVDIFVMCQQKMVLLLIFFLFKLIKTVTCFQFYMIFKGLIKVYMMTYICYRTNKDI